MTGEMGRDYSLPLLPDGALLFETLPFGAIVLEALSPAVGNGMITLRGVGTEGVLVIRDGVLSESVWVAEGVRTTGEAAMTLIRAGAVSVSACQLSGDAMMLVGPLLRADPCYTDLRLEWVVWPELLKDLRERGAVFLVELTTPAGRGVTVIDQGRHMATYVESRSGTGDPSLLDDLAAGSIGTIRVLIDCGGRSSVQAATVPLAAASDKALQRDVASANSADLVPVQADDPNATLSALFGSHAVEMSHFALVRTDPSTSRDWTSVESVLPQLKLLVKNRLQRSSESVEEVVDIAANDHQSLAWLADRVRVMTVRGFLPSTFDRLANDMLALEGRSTD